MTATSPTQLTLRHLRDAGWPLVEVVEHWVPATRRRKDFAGFVDVIAVGPDGTLAVQTTSDANVAARVRKIAESPNVAALREAGWAIHVHGWKQKRKGARWTLRTVDVS